jgi:hypothetical protein
MEDNFNMDLTNVDWDGVDWIHLALDRVQWRALVNTVMNLRFYRVIKSHCAAGRNKLFIFIS